MPYNIIKSGRKYELYLIDGNKLLGTHTSKKKAEEQIKAIEINRTGRKNPELYEKAKAIADEKYGEKHSARKQQQITRIYKDLGGEYTDDLKPNQKALRTWTLEDWGRDILPKGYDGRYLPKKIREQLTPEEYLKTSIAKMKGKTQYVKQPEEIVEKIRKIKEGKGKDIRETNGKKVGKYIYYVSDKPEKKLMTIVNGKKIYFGQMGYMHYKDKTGLLDKSLSHLDKDRRDRYIARASKIENKEGELTGLNPESPNYHAINILW